MPDLTPAERTLRARMAAHARWSREPDPAAATAAARQAAFDRFERQVDPDGTLPPAERARRAEHARKAYFTGLALKSAKARRKKAEAHNARVNVTPDATDRPEGRPDESLCGADLDGGARRAS